MMGKKPKKYFSESVLNESIDGFTSKFLPVDPTEANKVFTRVPIINAFYTYGSNYSSFRNQIVSPEKGKVEPKMEGITDKSLPYFYKAIGQMTDLSPKRLQAGAESVITSPNSSLPVGVLYTLLDMGAKMADIEYEGKYGAVSLKETSNPAVDNLLRSTSKKFIGTIDPNAAQHNVKEQSKKINEAAGSSRKQINMMVDRITKELRESTNKPEAIEKFKLEAKDLIKDIAKTDPAEAEYAMSTIKNSLSKKPYSRVFDEIKYAKTDEAKAKILELTIGKYDENELKRFLIEMNSGNGYRLRKETILHYKKLSE
jgi:hypothetical protein